MRRRVSVRRKGVAQLPRGGISDTSVTLPRGARLEQVRLVCLQPHRGAPGTWIVTDDEGATIYLSQPFNPGDPPFETVVNVPNREPPSGSLTLKIVSSGFSFWHLGYLELRYAVQS